MAEQVIATVVGPDTVIRGELRCAGDLVVHGSVEGTVTCGGMLRLEPGGTIDAEVRARGAVLAGRVRGDVNVVEAAELAASCRLFGDLRAARVAIAPGAAVRGRVELGDVGSEDDAWGAGDATVRGIEASAAEALPAAAPQAESAAGARPHPADVAAGATSAQAEQAEAPAGREAEGPDAAPFMDVEAAEGRALAGEVAAGVDAPPTQPSAEAGGDDGSAVHAGEVPGPLSEVAIEAIAAGPPHDGKQRGPPPIPASALALGVRSTVVIKP